MKSSFLLAAMVLFAVALALAQDKPSSTAPLDSQKSSDTASAATRGNLEVLSDTQGVDFGPYLSRVLDSVRRNWYNLVPPEARAPLMKQGKVSIEFVILPDGKVSGMKITEPSNDREFDRAAWGGITASVPFAPLPQEYHGQYLALRFHFYYNPAQSAKPAESK